MKNRKIKEFIALLIIPLLFSIILIINIVNVIYEVRKDEFISYAKIILVN